MLDNGAGVVTATDTFGADGLLSRRAGGSSVFYTFDPSGNTCQRLDAGANVLSSDLYDGFGNRQSTGGADVFGFSGQWGGYTDAETGLVLLTHRYYDPAAGRFLTRDPAGYAGGINLYAYCTNNPVNEADPNGFYPRSFPGDPSGPGDNVNEGAHWPYGWPDDDRGCGCDGGEAGPPSGGDGPPVSDGNPSSPPIPGFPGTGGNPGGGGWHTTPIGVIGITIGGTVIGVIGGHFWPSPSPPTTVINITNNYPPGYPGSVPPAPQPGGGGSSSCHRAGVPGFGQPGDPFGPGGHGFGAGPIHFPY